MKFALSIPGHDVRQATELGFDAVELTTVPSNPPAGLPVACLATTLSMPPHKREEPAQAAQIRGFIDLVSEAGCKYVRFLDVALRSTESPNSAVVAMARWLTPLADYAAERGVVLVIENALSFRKSRQIWMMLESINHPAVGACWNLANAAIAGESPAISVPTLNSRIRYARLTGPTLPPDTRHFLTRLQGIGYTGYVGVDLPPEQLANAITQLREWTKPQTTTKKPALAK